MDTVGQQPQDLPTIEGYEFQRMYSLLNTMAVANSAVGEQFGVMKASELARPPIRVLNMNTSSTSTSSPATPGSMKGSSGGSGRPPDQQQPHDYFAIYELFTSAVVALISYCLVSQHDAIALNYRTFLSKPVFEEESNQHKLDTSRLPLWLTNINVCWASSGTLIVSNYSVPEPDIRCLDEVTTNEAQKQVLGCCIRVAPNGSLAQIMSFDDPLGTVVDDTNQRLQRKKARTGPEQGIERWKTVVKRWLSWKGYSLLDLERRTSWVKIRIAQTSQLVPPSPSFLNQSREVLWPRCLCFFYDTPTPTGSKLHSLSRPPSSQQDNALEWFETSQSSGFRDPIDVARQWFLAKPERDKALEARRRAQKAEEEAARPKEENPGGLFPSSPLNSRTGAYGDLQAVSGVYPTPPDGVLPGTAVSSGDTPSISGTVASTVLVSGGNNPSINLSAPQDISSEEQHQPSTSPGFPETFNASAGNDDLFEDMDEDGFEGNGVTDADFNFFDDPDDDDIDMLDVPASQDSASFPEKKTGKEKEGPVVPETDIKDDISDPLAALENALASASGPLLGPSHDTKLEDHIDQKVPIHQAEKDSDIEKHMPSSPKSAISVQKEPTPPLSPHHIQERLLPSPKNKPAPQTPRKSAVDHHRDSVFDPVSFNRKMSLTDSKYKEGRFSFPHGEPEREHSETKTKLKRPASLRDLPLLTKLRYAIGVASTNSIPEVTSLTRIDSDFSDSTSEASSVDEEEANDLVSLPPEPLSASLVGPGKRKFPTDGNATPMSVTSFADSFGGDYLELGGLQIDDSTLVAFEASPSDWALTNMPAPAELPSTTARFSVPSFSPIVTSMPNTPTSQSDLSLEPPEEKSLSGKDSIAVAQVVTEQIVSASLDILHDDASVRKGIQQGHPNTRFHGAIRSLFPKTIECSVVTLISTADVFPELPPQAKGQQRPPPRRPNELPALPGYHIHQISPPHVRVRRADILWDMLPPALAFWESLGLSPCNPPKNVSTICIYPYSDSLRPCLEHFMTNLQIAYESCKLGSHERAETIPDYEGGLVPCRINTKSSRIAFKTLRETCTTLGKILAAKHAQMRDGDDSPKIDAFVIYMVDPFEDASAIWELCSAFWALFQAYGQGPPARPDFVPKPDLVLQIVPIKYIASFDVPVNMDASTYTSLAREVYDRCPPSAPSEDRTPLSIYAAPSFQLEESIPRGIPFKLNSEPPQDLLRENSYIHVGYAVSLDGTWITTAWTDNSGKSRAVVSYNLGTRAFSEIAREIWNTTIEILSARRVTWRVCIAKAGVMDREEFETWVFLASCPTQLNLFITLLTVDTNPPLKFTPTMQPSTQQSTTSTTAHGATNTPGSTPQAGVSPDPHGLTPAATPSAENAQDSSNDPEARLVDITDESWGVILSHRLHNTHSTVEFRPCLISGLLIKRGLSSNPTQPPTVPTPPFTLDPERGPIIVGVNIIWVGAVNSTRAATSPFPPSASGEGVSPGGQGLPSPATTSVSATESGRTSLMWTPTPQHRATAENLLKEVLAQFRALGTLAKLRGIRGSRMGTVPWHVAVAKRGVEGLGRCVPQS